MTNKTISCTSITRAKQLHISLYSHRTITKLLTHLDGINPSDKRRFSNRAQDFDFRSVALMTLNLPVGCSSFPYISHIEYYVTYTINNLRVISYFTWPMPKLRSTLFWSHNYRTVCKYVRSCFLCQLRKR